MISSSGCIKCITKNSLRILFWIPGYHFLINKDSDQPTPVLSRKAGSQRAGTTSVNNLIGFVQLCLFQEDIACANYFPAPIFSIGFQLLREQQITGYNPFLC